MSGREGGKERERSSVRATGGRAEPERRTIGGTCRTVKLVRCVSVDCFVGSFERGKGKGRRR